MLCRFPYRVQQKMVNGVRSLFSGASNSFAIAHTTDSTASCSKDTATLDGQLVSRSKPRLRAHEQILREHELLDRGRPLGRVRHSSTSLPEALAGVRVLLGQEPAPPGPRREELRVDVRVSIMFHRVEWRDCGQYGNGKEWRLMSSDATITRLVKHRPGPLQVSQDHLESVAPDVAGGIGTGRRRPCLQVERRAEQRADPRNEHIESRGLTTG